MTAKDFLKKVSEIYILFFATVHLLYFGLDGYSHIFEAKLITFFTANSIMFLFAVFFFFYFRYSENIDIMSKIKSRLSPAHTCIILYLLFTAISSVLSEHFPETIRGISRCEGLLTITVYCFMFAVTSLLPYVKKYTLTAFAVAVTVFSALSVIQLFSYNPFSLYPEGTNFYDAGVRYTSAFIGTIGNANLSGAFICIALPLLTVITIKSKSKLRFLLAIPIFMLLFISAKMGVDSTVLALIATAALSFPFIAGFRKKQITVYCIALFVLLLAFIVTIYFFAPSDGMLHELSEILHGNISDTFGSGRIRIWKNVLSEIPDSPIFGKGPDTMKREGFKPFERYYPELSRTVKTGIDIAHNDFLNILYHQGILGLISYLGFIFFIIRSIWKNKSDILILALGCAFICYLIQSFFTFSMCASSPYFWICAGLISGLSARNTN